MPQIGLLTAGRATLVMLTLMTALVASPIIGWADQSPSAPADQATSSDNPAPKPAGTEKPQTDEASRSHHATTGSAAQPPSSPGTAEDDRELVKRRMAICRQRPEICVQQGEQHEATAQPPSTPSQEK